MVWLAVAAAEPPTEAAAEKPWSETTASTDWTPVIWFWVPWPKRPRTLEVRLLMALPRIEEAEALLSLARSTAISLLVSAKVKLVAPMPVMEEKASALTAPLTASA